MAQLKVTQVKSSIKTTNVQKKNIEALGLGRPSYSNVVPDNEQIRGMIKKVQHLVEVETINN